MRRIGRWIASDLLMMFPLKACGPLVYRDRVQHLNVDPSTWTDRRLDAYIGEMPRRGVLALEDH